MRKQFRLPETIKQMEFIAWQSLPVVLFCVAFAAIVTILESAFHMRMAIQNDSMVPGFAAMLILRELAVVVTALLVTSRVGAGMTAEISSMKITEQVEALKMLGIQPWNFIWMPRFIASILSLALLTALANSFCLFSAFWVSNTYLGFSQGMFIGSLQRFIDLQDFLLSLVKGAAFGAIIPTVSYYFGMNCKDGAEGVGQSTTNSVVCSSLLIILVDFALGYMFSFLY